MEQKTHLSIDPKLVGRPQTIEKDRAHVRLATTPEMAADEHGLVHGGFVFGLADYAAMLAVNHPHVVLGSASTRFLAPVRVGEILDAQADVKGRKGRKCMVDVKVSRAGEEVLTGELTCFILDRHVLDK